MLKIDNSLLQEVGLGALPDDEKNSLLKHIYETLEMRVGMRLADQMSNEQLDEFEQYFEAKDDAGAFKWLETNFPNYKDIVQEEFDKLKLEVSQSTPQILGASQHQATAPAPAVLQQPPQQDMVLPPQGQYQQMQPAPQQQPWPQPMDQQQPSQPTMQQQPQTAPMQPYTASVQPQPYQQQVPPQPIAQSQQPWTQPQQPQQTTTQQVPMQQAAVPYYPDQQPPAGPGAQPMQ
jgi:hypothetical protein